MKPAIHSFVACLASALFAAAPMLAAAAAAEPVAKVVPDCTVFVDLPTAFVFLKLPAGWKFAGKVDDRDLARLPDGVVTALLTDAANADESSRLALRRAK